ncbi:MAG: VapC toxin family PIN domain ribonuclease [Comamonadaceae bacterium CG2_30_59_20]|nr:MAG: VapC toxin family PIN domain ribonuclease [Comamonadaceae bacterium CG2_30_59_20]
MIAFDTNMLVRALVLDNPAQADVARQLMAANTVFISRTVLLETEWVLRTRYKISKDQMQEFFIALLASENAVVEAADTVSHALDWYAQGADFADALHLSACDAAVLHTFDREFCKAARSVGATPEVRIWEV